jgi:hypothetical protein
MEAYLTIQEVAAKVKLSAHNSCPNACLETASKNF